MTTASSITPREAADGVSTRLFTLLWNTTPRDGKKASLQAGLLIPEPAISSENSYQTSFGGREFSRTVSECFLPVRRILTYDTKTKKSGVLLDGLAFPNGVQLTADRKALLFSELNAKKIHRVELQGPSKGIVLYEGMR